MFVCRRRSRGYDGWLAQVVAGYVGTYVGRYASSVAVGSIRSRGAAAQGTTPCAPSSQPTHPSRRPPSRRVSSRLLSSRHPRASLSRFTRCCLAPVSPCLTPAPLTPCATTSQCRNAATLYIRQGGNEGLNDKRAGVGFSNVRFLLRLSRARARGRCWWWWWCETSK